MAEIWLMVTNRAVISLHQDSGLGFFCNLFRGFRPVTNLKLLKQFLHNPHFKMETSKAIKTASPSDWSVSIDLTDAYFHVPINLEHQHFLHFVVSPTETYHFRAPPFSLSSAPWIFMMVLREVAQYVQHCAIKFHFYLNDWLICHRDPAILVEYLIFVLGLATCWGCLVNLKKSDLDTL